MLLPDFPLHMLAEAASSRGGLRDEAFSSVLTSGMKEDTVQFVGAQKWPFSELEIAQLPTLLTLTQFCLILSLMLYPTYLQAS